MQINLQVKMEAMPILSPTVLDKYVTKEALEASHYVSDVENPNAGVTYGRKDGEWSPINEGNEVTPTQPSTEEI